MRGVPLCIKLQQLGGHVLHGLSYAGLGSGPLLRAKPVQHRRGAGIGRAVFLDQVEPSERNVELGSLGEFQDHELDRKPVLLDLLQALVLRDAMLHMNDVVADAEIAKVRDKGRGLRFPGNGARRNVSFIGEIVGAEDDQVRVHKHDARCQRRAHDHRHAQVASHVTGFLEHRVASARRTAAQPVWNFVFAKNSRQALHVALMRSGKHDARLRRHQLLQLLGQRGKGAVESQCGARGQLDFAKGCVRLQHIHRAQLIEIESHMRIERGLQNLGPQINVFRPEERANPGAFVTQLDLAPPAVDLAAHHRRLIDKQHAARQEREQRPLRSGHGCKNTLTPPATAASAAILSFSVSTRCRLSRPLTAASNCSVAGVSVSGSSSVSSSPLCERCVSGSNLRIVSISSPKNSMRTGRSNSGE